MSHSILRRRQRARKMAGMPLQCSGAIRHSSGSPQKHAWPAADLRETFALELADAPCHARAAGLLQQLQRLAQSASMRVSCCWRHH